MEVILASRSPRRLQLLQAAGLAVEVRPSHVDETPIEGESVTGLVERLAHAKAHACSAEYQPVIAADTLVELDGQPLGQPADLNEAAKMLLALSGKWHRVLTGVCVRLGDRCLHEIASTRVHFRALSRHEIDTYLIHNEVLDKAGAYAIQQGGASFIDGLEGPLDNVIGLPTACTLRLLRKIGPGESP
ncbi:MAG: septum formation protein Maf [Zetaproteobacteria bacterium]|nr:MAG: septum formation protein Maf [Zetaproteobacteria bacterium]